VKRVDKTKRGAKKTKVIISLAKDKSSDGIEKTRIPAKKQTET